MARSSGQAAKEKSGFPHARGEPPTIPIHADTGYHGSRKLHVNTHKPAKATERHPLTAEQKRANRQVNPQRVVVEHGFRRFQVFRLLGERYRNRRKRFGLRLNLIAALTNLPF